MEKSKAHFPAAIPRSNFSEPFWEGTRHRRLFLQYCPRARRYQFFPRPVSIFTGRRELEWKEVSGRGSLYSYTIARMAPKAFRDRVPYIIALVELDEKVRLISGLLNVQETDVRIGMAVEPVWIPNPDGTHLLHFQPADPLIRVSNPGPLQ